MKKLLLLSAATLFLFSCKGNKKDLSQFSWLQGKWEGTADDEQIAEQWQPINGNTMSGSGWAIAGQDTVFKEQMTIEQRGEDIFYIAMVAENGGPVDFKYTGEKNDSIVFENPQHDFPQRVVYFKQGAEKLYACIDGLIKGSYAKMEFSYTKAK